MEATASLHLASDTPLSKRGRARELFAHYQRTIHERTDRLFAALMVFQWMLVSSSR